MKHFFKGILFFLLLSNCSNSDDGYKNEYLPDIDFDTGNTINLTLPAYNDLNFAGNSKKFNGYGVNGFVLYCIGNGSYTAFELTDPNHAVTSCSKLAVNGIHATCSCPDENTYEIVSGALTEGEGKYTLKPYYVEVNGNIIRVYND